MQLPKILTKFIPKRKEIKTAESFLALEIGESQVKAAVWEYFEDEGRIDLKDFVKAKSASEAIVQIKEKFDLPLKKLILGLMPSSVDGDKIKKEEIEKIKPTAEKFFLTPLGFVVIPEAIAHLLKKQHETPQSAIFMGVGKKTLTLSLFRGGKSKDFASVEISGNLFTDFEKGLANFIKEEVLPSKIILYNGEEKLLEEIKEELLTYPWQKNVKFLHVPKIEILPWEFSIKAIVDAAGSKMAQSVDAPKETVLETAPLERKTVVDNVADEDETFGFSNKEVVDNKTDEELVEKKEETTFEEKEVILPRPKTKFNFHLPSFAFLSIGGIGKMIPLIIALVILGAVFVSSLYFYPSVAIKLVVEPKIVDQNVKISLNPQIDVLDTENKEIPGKVYTAELAGDKTQGTTGKKTIGEKAKGEVTVYNKTAGEKKFAAGTIISGLSNLTFSLDEDAIVASASDTGESLEYGKVKVKTTAVRIGPLSNIKKDNEFKVDDYATSSFVARNEADFSGGTEREIDVVSKDDQDKLLNSLSEELKNQAKEKLDSQVEATEKILAESIKENIVEKVFDKEAGEEADNISLKLKIEFSAISYKEDDLNNFLQQYIVGQIPSDFEYDSDKSYFNVQNIKFEKEGSVVFNADYHAYLLPKIDSKDFRKKITGKSLKDLEEEVKKMNNQSVLGYEIEYRRRFILFRDKLPLLGRNIEVSIVPY